ncbi:MAG: IGHMBP2 family helicase [Candidatus Latescibacteria bacterium]|nr:IGHMBP2 family helicase [bacterium]MBD3422984.1 IGHMBP2 family helicase [Candidatus Latescibacterota bacterium]
MKKEKKYLKKFRSLVEKERAEEMRWHENEIRRLSGKEREKRGRAILNLRGRNQGTGLGGRYIVKFLRQRHGEMLPEHEFNTGDLVMLSRGNPLSADTPSGTVIEKSRFSITAVFDKAPPRYIFKKNLRMDLYVNDITFQRMIEALGILAAARGRLARMRNKLLGISDIRGPEPAELELFNKELNEVQVRAVRKAISSDDIFLIHGPAGTGKTMTCIEVIQQAVKRGLTVLSAAGSNVAVDNIVERLVKRGVRAVRVGHPARVNPVLREHTLDYILEDHPDFQKAQQLREKAMGLKDKQDNHTHPGPRWRRGMSNEKIMTLAQKGRGNRGVPASRIKDMAEWMKIQEVVDGIFSEVDRLENDAVDKILMDAEVVCTTNSTAGSEIMSGRNYELLILDEATQSTEPEALIPLVKADRVVLAGDHRQLPPTILNKEAGEKGLAVSLFERLLEVHGEKIKEMLRVQYRMNRMIMSFPSREFYSGELEADQAVIDWTLADLELETPSDPLMKKIFDPAQPVIFLDTVEKCSGEESVKDSKSYYNRVEGEMSVKILETALETGLDPGEVALISPYKDQTDWIRSGIDEERVEIDTVDGFQGREKEMIILSLVRTNDSGNIGFLKDLRRLNVSLTRAKKKLVIIGHSPTVGSHPCYRRLIDSVREAGGYMHTG